MRDTTDCLIAAFTYIIRSAGVPLPAFDEAYSLSDDTITNFVVATHELVMVGDVGSSPLRGFVVSNSILISVQQVITGIHLTFVATDIQDERGAVHFLNQDL